MHGHHCLRYSDLYLFLFWVFDEFICNHWVDATAGGVLIPWGYHQPSSQHFCTDMNYYWYGHIYKLIVYKIMNFWHTKVFLPQE